jgi:hypothetical protein
MRIEVSIRPVMFQGKVDSWLIIIDGVRQPGFYDTRLLAETKLRERFPGLEPMTRRPDGSYKGAANL